MQYTWRQTHRVLFFFANGKPQHCTEILFMPWPSLCVCVGNLHQFSFDKKNPHFLFNFGSACEKLPVGVGSCSFSGFFSSQFMSYARCEWKKMFTNWIKMCAGEREWMMTAKKISAMWWLFYVNFATLTLSLYLVKESTMNGIYKNVLEELGGWMSMWMG